MKQFWIAAILAAQAVVAHGQSAPTPVSPANWAGAYGGLQVGLTLGRVEGTGTTFDPNIFATFTRTITHNNENLLGGLHAGYNFQRGAFVFGIEADAELAAGRDSQRSRENYRGSLRARAGYAFGSTLLFASAGPALRDRTAVFTNGLGPTISRGHTFVGVTLGAGVEYAFASNWSMRAEYRYTDFGSSGVSYNLPAGGGIFSIVAPACPAIGVCVAAAPLTDSWRFRNQDHSMRLGLTYRFGGAMN